MAAFHPELRAALLAGLLAIALPVTAATPRPVLRDPACAQPVDVSARDNALIDIRANRVTLIDVTITQCDLSIQADKAVESGTGISFNDSHWEFTGKVRILFKGGSLQAQAASVRFAGNRIAEAQAAGTPAEFEQQLENLPRPVHGRADAIDYDFIAQSVRFDGDAFLFDGRNEMTNQTILYSIKDQQIQLNAAPGSRVNITIRPEANAPSPPPAPTPQGGRQ